MIGIAGKRAVGCALDGGRVAVKGSLMLPQSSDHEPNSAGASRGGVVVGSCGHSWVQQSSHTNFKSSELAMASTGRPWQTVKDGHEG